MGTENKLDSLMAKTSEILTIVRNNELGQEGVEERVTLLEADMSKANSDISTLQGDTVNVQDMANEIDDLKKEIANLRTRLEIVESRVNQDFETLAVEKLTELLKGLTITINRKTR